MKRLLVFVILILFLSSPVLADNTADNNLESLYAPNNKVNWAVQVDGWYPELLSNSYLDKWTMRPGVSSDRKSFYFDVSKPENVEMAYIYIFMAGYDCLVVGCEPWTVRFNGNTLVAGEHTNSQGPNPRGDSSNGGGGRQTIRFEVTDYVANGENDLYIRADDFDSTSEQYYIDGIMLVTFYQSPEQHEYWVYDGVEYLEIKTVTDDFFYSEALEGATYPDGSTGTLYSVTGIEDDDTNGFEEDDALYFNDNLLDPQTSNYLIGTENSSRLDITKFDVTDYLDSSDEVKFTFKENAASFPVSGVEQNVPIYPAFFLLDVNFGDSSPPDETPPVVTPVTPANNSVITGDKTVFLIFSVDDTSATVVFNIDGTEVTPTETLSGEWSYSWNLTGVSRKLYNITAVATDPAGNNGSATIFVDVTPPAGETTTTTSTSLTTTTTVEGQTTLSTTSTTATSTTDTVSTTTTTTTTTTTLSPPVTSPPVTAPPVRKVDLSINSLTLSTGSSTLERGADVTVYVLASNSGDTPVEATIALYSDDEILESKTSDIGAYEVKEREFFIRANRLKPGSHKLMAKILVQGDLAVETSPSDNERSVDIVVVEKGSLTDSLGPYLKWAAIIVILAGVGKIIYTFVMERDEDYLR
ncbi:hypothetical protein BMS3Abin16_00858 [archaeon BMS3Abin16]|nr:hypothetical protein BMS3Abin16_00858 [archaeon BMS3Abin16]HDY74386.1 hypothetical protein [Euryarchaeota archaeon]